MDIPSALSAELDRLTQALDDPSVDVARAVHRLAADARSAVASYRGLSLTVQAEDGAALTLTVVDEPVDHEVHASLAVPFTSEAGAASALLVLYASRPGAFVDMAADLAWLTGRPLAGLVLDEHLDPAARPANLVSWQDASVVNQAIGVLMGKGFTPEEARELLEATAKADGGDTAAAARQVLASLPDPAEES